MKSLMKKIAALTVALATVVTMSGCVVAGGNRSEIDGSEFLEEEIQQPSEESPEIQPPTEQEPPAEQEVPAEPEPEPEPEPIPEPEPVPEPEPKVNTVAYLKVNSENVNIRSGAGTNYSVRGTAEKSTLYVMEEKTGSWYKTEYKNKPAYISSQFCTVVEMEESENARIEAVIDEGTKLLGTVYVYGAVRLHDGKGNMYRGFTVTEFDCSSLMQYIFYKGAGKLLNVNTRTQISQGKTVKRSELRRGDLMFFTNDSRRNNTGLERVGHVALYLGGNWILHTASDYAKIEQISAKRWSYFIQGQRIL